MSEPHQAGTPPGPRGFRIVEGGHLVVPAVAVEMAVCAALAAVGLWFFLGAQDLPRSGRAAIKPGTFPMLMAAGLMALAAAQAALSVLRARATAPVWFERPLATLCGIGLVLAFPGLVGALGFYPAAALWLPAFALAAGLRPWQWIAGVTAGLLLFARVVFEGLFGTPLP